MIPLDLLFALSPSIVLACLWLAERRPRRRLDRHELLKLVADADRHAYPRRRSPQLPG
jgi:hypothetical protein